MTRTHLWVTAACAVWITGSVSACRAASQQKTPPTVRDSVLIAAREIMEEARLAALITLDERGSPRARTMDAFAPDDHMIVWLGTHRATRKVRDIQRDPRVALYYVLPDGDGYVSISGVAELVDDPAEKAQRWKEEWEQYYSDRASQYLLIKVRPIRLEVVNYRRGVVGDSATWRPPTVEFEER